MTRVQRKLAQGRIIVCSNCGKIARGKQPGCIAKGWLSKYISYDDSIYGCSEECFNQAKENRNVGNKTKRLQRAGSP